MPAAVYHNDTALSFAYAINKAQDTFTINRDAEGNRTDGFLKDSAKVVTRVPVNMTLATLAIIETVVKAILTAVSSLLYLATDVPFNYFKDATALAGRATKEALKGILGYASPKPAIKVEKEIIEADVVEVTPAPTTEVEEEVVVVEEEEIVEDRSYLQRGQDFVNSLSTRQKVLGVVALGVVLYAVPGPTLRAIKTLVVGSLKNAGTLGCGVTQTSGNLADKVTFGYLSNNTLSNWVASTSVAQRLTNLCA
jgi:hypothetical protein